MGSTTAICQDRYFRMKVYFTGSHSSGKSTLARYVSDKYELRLLPECARMVLSEMELQVDVLRSDIDLVNIYQTKVFYRQIEEEKSQQGDFVSDRSAIDCLAYCGQHSTILLTVMRDSGLEPYLEKLRDPNSILFFVRPSRATLKADGVRESLTWDGIVAIDAQIKLLLELFGLRYFQISAESMQERIRLVDSVLSFS